MAFSARRFERNVRDAIVRHSMIRGGEKVLVAVSGGPDSLALLYSLMSLRGDLGFEMAACHLDHGFRGDESKSDAAFVSRLCDSLGMPCLVESEDVPALMEEMGVGPEEAGRVARYRFFERAAAKVGADRVALGHTMDDQAETVLMRLIRGSGLDGLGGIPPVRGMYIRPLLYTSRRDIERYCGAVGVEPRIDRTNLEPMYFRNQVRLEIIPLLERWNPRIRETLAGTAGRLREDAAYLESMAAEALDALLPRAGAQHGERGPVGRVELDRERFGSLPGSLQRWVLRAAARRAVRSEDAVDPLGFAHVEAVVDLARAGRRGASLDLPGGLAARLGDGGRTIVIERAGGRGAADGGHGGRALPSPVVVAVPGVTDLPALGMRVHARVEERASCGPPGEVEPEIAANPDRAVAYVDYALVEQPLVVRSKADGDWFYPLGLGGSKKVGDFMTSLKIPPEERGRIPVFLSNGRVVWVGGCRLDERFKVTERTRRLLVLRIECEPPGGAPWSPASGRY